MFRGMRCGTTTIVVVRRQRVNDAFKCPTDVNKVLPKQKNALFFFDLHNFCTKQTLLLTKVC